MHRILTLLFSGLLLISVNAQTANFAGCVTDEAGEPLVGANVIEAETGRGTVTDLEGCFQLAAASDSLEIFLSYIGYEQRSAILRLTADNQFVLRASAELLEEVVVGYGERYYPGRSESLSIEGARLTSRGIASDVAGAPPPPPPPPSPLGDASKMYRKAAPEPSPAAGRRIDPESLPEASSREERAGQLTAGEVNDFGKWDMWQDIGGEDLARHHATWKLFAKERYAVLLGYADGTPAAGIPVALQSADGKVLWRSVTDNTGRAELWANFLTEQSQKTNRLQVVADPGSAAAVTIPAVAFHGEQGRIQYLELPGPCYAAPTIDVAFVVDATGSMSDEIAFLQAELADVIGRVKDSLPTADLRLGSVFYRDRGDDYLTRISPFSPKIGQTVAFIKTQRAGGGGDTPEAVEDALLAAVDSLAWRPEAAAKILFLILDAPPHAGQENLDKLYAVIQRAAAAGIRILPVACSGVDKSTEYLLRNMALATNGTYTFLTDHSGIGNPHIEPTTDLYDVEKLNDLLVRLSIQFGRPVGCGEPLPDPIRPLALVDPEVPTRLHCFPNPTLGPLTVNLTRPGGTLLLNDLYGRVLEAHRVAEKTYDLDLIQYPAGTYFLSYYLEDDESDVVRQSVVRAGAR